MIFLVFRVKFNFSVFMKQNTILFNLYLVVFILIISLQSADWYLDKCNITYITYMGFLSRSLIYIYIYIYIYLIFIY